MLGRSMRTGFAVAWLAALGGCAAATLGEGGGGAIPVGANLIGETCRAEAQPADLRLAAEGQAGQSYNVYCGAWEQPSGRILKLTGAAASVGDAVKAGPWRQRLDLLAACDAPLTSRIAADVEATVLDCRLRGGGWPYVAFAAPAAGALYLADGIPAAQPALERTVAVLSGAARAGAATDPATDSATERSAAVRRLEAKLGGKMFGAGDLQDYQTLLRLGSYYNGAKDFSAAEERYRGALEIHQRVLGIDDPEFGDPLMHLALEASNQERFTVAEDLLDRAGPLLKQAIDPADYARFVSYRALHEANQQNYEKALAFAREATSLRMWIAAEAQGLVGLGDKAGLFSGPVAEIASGAAVLRTPANVAAIDVAQSLIVEAAMLHRTGRDAEARNVANDALRVVESSVDTPDIWRPQILELSAEINADLGNFDAALSAMKSALASRQTLLPGSRPLAVSYLKLGDIHAKQGRRQEALEAYRAGTAIMAKLGESLRQAQVQPYLDQLWEEAQASPERRDRLNIEMFDAAQLVRGAVAAQNIGEATARLAASDQQVGAVIRRLQDARRERDSLLFSFNRLAARAITAEDRLALDRMRQRIAELGSRIEALEVEVQAAAPALNLLRDRTSNFAQLTAQLRPDEALVQILPGNPDSYVFLVRDARVRVNRVDASAELIAKAVTRLRDAFIVRREGGGAQVGAFDVRLAHVLYERLIGPMAADLDGVTHLVNVPSGPLMSLPLGLLVTAPPPEVVNSDYSAVAWLMGKTSISLSPSVRAFVDLRGRARPSRAPKAFLGFGDFVPSGDPDMVMASRGLPEGCRAGAEAIAGAPRLPETADQVRAIAASFGGGADSTILGADFSEATIKSLPLDQYRILVFATHGLLPGQLDCLAEPSLIVSRPGAAAPGEDGLLTYSEIFDLNLDAEMVVLSACNTGGPLSQVGGGTAAVELGNARLALATDQGESDKARGESLAGLTRAFFYAGARSLLVSNWEVYTEATVALMVRTFSNLQGAERLTPAEALRQAKLSFMTSPGTSHPYLWASFELIGDGGRQSAPAVSSAREKQSPRAG